VIPFLRNVVELILTDSANVSGAVECGSYVFMAMADTTPNVPWG